LIPLILLACDGLSTSVTAVGGEVICEGYPPVEGSPYVLPYPVGTAFRVMTSNCNGGHMGTNKYGYDFRMPIGAPVTAMRGGTVVGVKEGFLDSQGGGLSNQLVIDHGDGTFSTYFHMTHEGIVVDLGDHVSRGELVAFSGNSGTSPPHLHVHVKRCNDFEVFCLSEPFQFANADPPPSPTGLEDEVVYTALPFGMDGGPLEAEGASARPADPSTAAPSPPVPRAPGRARSPERPRG
jgi:murein DD-endopeptidase MepM/ murein hydrolase activator NlpD